MLGCLYVPNKPYGFCGQKGKLNLKSLPEFRGCVKVEVVIQSSPSLISLMVSVDGKALGVWLNSCLSDRVRGGAP